jgi:superfamily II DNA/RNA helicase
VRLKFDDVNKPKRIK